MKKGQASDGSRQGEGDQQQGAHELHGIAALHDQAALDPVGGRAGDRQQQQRRGEFGEADQAEIERAAGEVVDLPEQRRRLHLEAEIAEQRAEPIGGEIAMAEGDEGAARRRR